MTEDARTLIEDVLVRGLDDWVHVAEVASSASEANSEDCTGIRLLAIGIITTLLCQNSWVAGDVDELGFHPWEIPLGDVLTRIIETWPEDMLYPTPGYVCWFCLTSKGEAIGESILAREGHTSSSD